MGVELKVLWSIPSNYVYTKGLDKLKIVDVYGEAMVNEWRRSLVVAPPKMF